MTANFQITDSGLSTLLWTNWKPRVSLSGSQESFFIPEYPQPRLAIRYQVALIQLGTVAEYSPPRGYTIFMSDLREDGLQLTAAIPVRIEADEGAYSAYNPDLEVFGIGDSEAEALDDFRTAVSDLYRLLKEEGEANLGPLPRRQWRYLRAILREE
jgi:hypothetical protein